MSIVHQMNSLSLMFSSILSAYTEPFPVCPVSATLSNEEDHGRTSEEEEGCGDHCHDRQVS